MAAEPGTAFAYCGGNPHLLSVILEKVTGDGTRQYANQVLFAPLGIEAVPAERWWPNAQNHTIGSYGLHLSPRELAKLGLLYAQEGWWDGQQVVPAEWVRASAQSYITKEDGSGYGYLWTVYPGAGRYAALGLGEQQIHVVPEQNLVVVMTAAVKEFGETSPVYRLVPDYILPAVRGDKPLAENPAAQAALAEHVAQALQPRQPVPALPAAAAAVSGQTFALAENPFGWTDMTFRFEPGASTALLEMTGQPALSVGLDNLFRATEVGPGLSMQLRGAWTSADTFAVEYPYPLNSAPVLGELGENVIAVTFQGGTLAITVQETVFGGPPVKLHGALASD
jgi:hypothetical protein